MDADAKPWFPAAMARNLWHQRAKEAGLSQRVLARLVGKAPMTISRALRGRWKQGVPRYLKAVITAWRLMTPEQRRAWLAAMDAAEADDDEAQNEKTPRQP